MVSFSNAWSVGPAVMLKADSDIEGDSLGQLMALIITENVPQPRVAHVVSVRHCPAFTRDYCHGLYRILLCGPLCVRISRFKGLTKHRRCRWTKYSTPTLRPASRNCRHRIARFQNSAAKSSGLLLRQRNGAMGRRKRDPHDSGPNASQ